MIIPDDKSMGIQHLPPDTLSSSKYAFILTDYVKWGKVQDAFDEWIEEQPATRNGMLVHYDDPEFFVMFKMVWS